MPKFKMIFGQRGETQGTEVIVEIYKHLKYSRIYNLVLDLKFR